MKKTSLFLGSFLALITLVFIVPRLLRGTIDKGPELQQEASESYVGIPYKISINFDSDALLQKFVDEYEIPQTLSAIKMMAPHTYSRQGTELYITYSPLAYSLSQQLEGQEQQFGIKEMNLVQ